MQKVTVYVYKQLHDICSVDFDFSAELNSEEDALKLINSYPEDSEYVFNLYTGKKVDESYYYKRKRYNSAAFMSAVIRGEIE